MHQPIKDNLEDFLKGKANRQAANQKMPQEFQAHLDACGDCATEVRMLEAQSEMLRTLRAEGEIEPRAGFYARVMNRIEQQGPASIWSILLEPKFGRRLAVASAALVLLLGTYLVTSEQSGEPEFANAPEVMMTGASAQSSLTGDGLQQERDRDAVLVNLAGYRQ